MAAGKARTDAQKIRATDLRLLKCYGITYDIREARRAVQNGLCACCNDPLDSHGGHACVDHFHFRVETVQYINPATGEIDGWVASGYDEDGLVVFQARHKTKAGAIKAVRTLMLPWSVRALLCVRCNYALGALERMMDASRHPENVVKLADYLKKCLTDHRNQRTIAKQYESTM